MKERWLGTQRNVPAAAAAARLIRMLKPRAGELAPLWPQISSCYYRKQLIAKVGRLTQR